MLHSTLLLNSAILAAGATAIALPLGTLLAVLIARLDLPGRRGAAACLGVLLFLPLYVQLSGWDAVLGKLGWYTLSYGSIDSPWLAGMRAAIFVHAVAAVPWVALIVSLGLMQTDSAQEEAALLDASPLSVLLRITLPQSRGFLLAAAVWVVVSTATEMTVTNIYLVPTYTEELYNRFALSADASDAALGVLPGFMGLAALIAATLWLVAKLSSRRLVMGTREPLLMPTGRAKIPLAALLWLIITATLLAVPVASLIYKTGFIVTQVEGERLRGWSLMKFSEVLSSAPQAFQDEFYFTIVCGLIAASLATALALLLAWPARRGGWRSAPAVVMNVLGLAIPGPLVGIGLIYLLNQSWSPFMIYLYDDTLLAPMLAQTIRSLPLATLLLWHSFASLNDDMLSAAELDGAGSLRTLLSIALPQRKAALAGAWLAAFAISTGDLAWSQLVIPPGMDTTPRRVFGLVHSGVEEQVAAICLIGIAAYALIAGLILWLIPGRR